MTVKSIFEAIKHYTPNTNPLTPSTWRGADLFLTDRADHPEYFQDDELLVHSNARDLIHGLGIALPLIMKDYAVGYDHLTKYDIIRDLVRDVNDPEPGREVLRRALKIVLTTHGRQLYFAYGSNMDLEQMKQRCPDAILLGTTELKHYQFLINSRGVASIRGNNESTVEGAVFVLTPTCKASLDQYEGVRFGTYRVQDVLDTTGLTLITYIARDSTPCIGSDSEYLRRIVAAARVLGLSRGHIDKIKSWALTSNDKQLL